MNITIVIIIINKYIDNLMKDLCKVGIDTFLQMDQVMLMTTYTY